MLALFAALRRLVGPRYGRVQIDNWAFKCHYRATVLVLSLATILVTLREYFGEHIQCVSDLGQFRKVIETFCFFTSTFTEVGGDPELQLYPGVGPYSVHSKQAIRRHTYYQWAPFMLFGQAIMFYVTRLLWKQLENGRIARLTSGFQNAAFAVLDKEVQVSGQTFPTRSARSAWLQTVKKAFLGLISTNRSWAWGLLACETLNLLHVVLQVYLTDAFLGQQFLPLGPRVLREGPQALEEAFPKMAKCVFHSYGPSGSIQTHDALCLMALNIIHEKVYVALWFWFLGLGVVSGAMLLWRVCVGACFARSLWLNRLVFGAHRRGTLDSWQVAVLVERLSYPDRLLLSYVAENMDALAFQELLQGIFEELDERKPFVGREF